jgi:hypothetical protein
LPFLIQVKRWNFPSAETLNKPNSIRNYEHNKLHTNVKKKKEKRKRKEEKEMKRGKRE